MFGGMVAVVLIDMTGNLDTVYPRWQLFWSGSVRPVGDLDYKL